MVKVQLSFEQCKISLTKRRPLKLKTNIADLQEKPNGLLNNEGPSNLVAIKQLQKEIKHLLDSENIKWLQKAKRRWYK